MSQHDQEKRSLGQDQVVAFQYDTFLIFATAKPFRYLWVRLGRIGKDQFGCADFAGLALIFPAFGGWPHDALDARIFMMAWQVMWIACVVQRIAASLLYRRYNIHTQEIGTRGWIGRNPVLPIFLVSPMAHFLVEPICFGLGRYLTVAPLAFYASYLIVNWKQDKESDQIHNARIAGDDMQRRI